MKQMVFSAFTVQLHRVRKYKQLLDFLAATLAGIFTIVLYHLLINTLFNRFEIEITNGCSFDKAYSRWIKDFS